MNARIRALLAKKAEKVQAMRALSDKAAAENRDLTADETVQFDALKAEVDSLKASISREEALAAEEAGLSVADVRAAAGRALPGVSVHDNREDDPRRGFNTFGEFARAVVAAGQRNAARIDERLAIGAAAPSTFANEASGADGGFLIPPEFSSELFRLALGEDSLIPYTANVQISGNSMAFPKTEQTPWGSNGVRAYWQLEATAGTPTKPVLGLQAMRLHKLMALTPLSEEMMDDAPALAGEIQSLVGDSIRWKTNEAILFGNGNGQPMGALISTGPAVTAAKDSGQAANTLSVTNFFTMISRLPPGSYMRAVWMIHPTVIPVLATLVLGQIPVFLPGGTANVGGLGPMPVFGTILGRPVIISHHCAALSSAGDVQLHDFSYYRTITKAGGVQTDSSMHLYFDAAATALRTMFRIDGAPKIAAAISPAKGSTTLSPFIQLQNR